MPHLKQRNLLKRVPDWVNEFSSYLNHLPCAHVCGVFFLIADFLRDRMKKKTINFDKKIPLVVSAEISGNKLMKLVVT